MDNSGLSLRKLATVLGVSQPFLSQIRAGKRPLPEDLKKKVEALGAYHMFISDKQVDETPGDAGAGQYLESSFRSHELFGGGEGNRTLGPLHAKLPA